MVQQMGECSPGDCDLQLARSSEIRQAELAWRVLLREEDFFLWPGHCTPLPNTPLQRAQHPVGEISGMLFLQLAQYRDRHQSRRTLQQRHDLRFPHRSEWIGARAPIVARFLRR